MNDNYTFAYNSSGAIIYATMGDQVPSWWPAELSTIILNDSSSVPGYQLFQNQRGTPFITPTAPTLMPYFSVNVNTTSIANQYTITATINDPPMSPPTTCTVTINGTPNTVDVTSNTAIYTFTVDNPMIQTNITVSATGVSPISTTIQPLNTQTFNGAINTINVQTAGVDVVDVSPPGTPSVGIEASGSVGVNLAASTTYTYGFTAIDPQGNETPLLYTANATTETTAYPINVTGVTVANAQSYWLYRDGVRLIQLTSPTYTDNGEIVPSTQGPPNVNKTGALNANVVDTNFITVNGGIAPVQNFQVTVVASGTVGSYLVASGSYQYTVTVVDAGTESVVCNGATGYESTTPYPITLSWNLVASNISNINVYKNGQFLIQLSNTVTSYVDGGSVNTTSQVAPTSYDNVGTTLNNITAWTGTIYGNTNATLMKTSSIDGKSYTIIDQGGRVYRAVYNDLAELFEKHGDCTCEPGDILIINHNKVTKSIGAYNKMVVGIYSNTYGFCLGGENKDSPEDNFDGYVPIGISGRVYVKLVGDVDEGDLITTSDLVGVGMRAAQYIPGTVVGKALETIRDNHDVTLVRVLITIM